MLNHVNVKVEPGKITTLIGPSGSGKSTLLRALAMVDLADSGSVEIDDVAYAFNGSELRADERPWPKVTIVFQQLHLWPNKTIRENITWPLKKRLNKPEISKGDNLKSLFEIFGILDFLDRYPNEVSVGQRQRAAIVRAIALQPKYLLLDEVTSALDVEYIAVLLEYLKTLAKRGTGILLITHLIGFASRASDRVVFLDRGSIEEEGEPTILTKPKSERLQGFLSIVEAAN